MKFSPPGRWFALMMVFSLSLFPARGADWEIAWTPAAVGETGVKAAICPLKYGKLWAYAVELDDGDRTTGLFAPGFFSQYMYTDAPAGEEGGKPLPVTGSFAVFAFRVGANSAYLNFEELRGLRAKGWAVANHSYFHRGKSYGAQPEILSPEEIRTDLFWSQALYRAELGPEAAPTHFVYPNGYVGYADYLKDYGLLSGSLVGGKGGIGLAEAKTDLRLLNRNYLDEGHWTSQWANGNPMAGFPAGGPKPGDLIIDFTHKMDPDPASPNQRRWKERLDTIARSFGGQFWSAPTGEIVNYSLAARAAKVQFKPGSLKVTVPDGVPGSALTLRLDGIDPTTAIPVPPGGALYRKGTSLWITTPVIGTPGAVPAAPKVKRIYQGPAEASVRLERPEKIAAVRLRQQGAGTAGGLKVELILPDGSAQPLDGGREAPAGYVAGTHLFATVPNRPAVLASEVRTAPFPALKEMEIWALDE